MGLIHQNVSKLRYLVLTSNFSYQKLIKRLEFLQVSKIIIYVINFLFKFVGLFWYQFWAFDKV